jgi:L-amino acid N-acyltransferase YncA
VAVTVVDAWQGRGLGTALLRRLARRSREEGITTWTAAVLAENEPMLAIFRRLGTTRATRVQAGAMDLEIELPDL